MPSAPSAEATTPGGPRAPAQPVAAPAGRRDAARALALAALLVAAYLGPTELLPGNDATGNVYTAAELVSTGRLTLSPARVPFLFGWREPGPGGRTHRLTDLSDRVDGVPAASLVAAGRLVPVAPYYLARAARDDPETGEARWVNGFGPGAAISAAPVLLPLRIVAGDLVRRPALLWAGARAAAALLTAAAAALLFLAARRWLAPWPAAGLALLFGLGTPAWSVASQTLWQHPADLFFLSLGAAALVRAERSRAAAALAGFALAAAAACRPQSAVFAAVAFGWLALRDRRGAAAFAAGALPPALGLLAWNVLYLGGPLRFGQVAVSGAIALQKTGVADPWPFRIHESLPGLLVSPSRGLLVFSPFLALSVAGAAVAFRRPGHEPLRPLALAAAALLAVEAGWFDWWGGWAYGWRRLLALAPALTLLLVPLAGWLAAAAWRRAVLGALAAWAIALQALGALAYDLSSWNARKAWDIALPSGERVLLLDPAEANAAVARGGVVKEIAYLDVDRPEHRGRLWAIADSQVVYTVEHFRWLRRSRRDGAAGWIAQYGPRR